MVVRVVGGKGDGSIDGTVALLPLQCTPPSKSRHHCPHVAVRIKERIIDCVFPPSPTPAGNRPDLPINLAVARWRGHQCMPQY
jgi:hypothetical protein